MRTLIFLFLSLLWLGACTPNSKPPDEQPGWDPNAFVSIYTQNSTPVQKITFGSCSRQDLPQLLWDDILMENPDLFIWLGDNVYADTEDMEQLAAYYQQQKSNPDYLAMRAAFPILGIWDDHDYGKNDGGKEYPQKVASQQVALDFLDVSDTASVRNREGIYQAYDWGEEGKLVRMILLDTRYHRDTLADSEEEHMRYQLNETGDVLGEAQWAWLRQQLTNSPAQVHIIGTSVQLLANDHGYEKWGNFPKARQRMFDLLEELQVATPIFISGDRHIAELSRLDLEKLPDPVYEFTSSGLTHTWDEPGEELNVLRVGDLVIQLNYGVIEIDWDAKEIGFRVRGEEQAEFFTHTISLP
ncbi:MAG: alkaline phosphatase D family protein [Bacteroidota bacterium]